MKRSPLAFFFVTLSLACKSTLAQAPIGSDFVYQGRLTADSTPASGPHDLRFRLFDAATAGNQVGPTLCSDDVSVSNGLFAAALDFGAQFNGQQRFLEIEVRADSGFGCGDASGFVVLSPRQAITAAPYALHVPGIDRHSLDAADGSSTDVVFVGNNGNTGIGTVNPSAKLEVSGGVRFNGLLTFSGDLDSLDQAQENLPTTANAPDVWQSFTAGQTGILSRVDYVAGSTDSVRSAEMLIYAGEGIAGSLLGAQSYVLPITPIPSSWVSIPLTGGVAVTAGQQYTLRFRRTTGGSSHAFRIDATNPYAGGRFQANPSTDMTFRTYLGAGGIIFPDGTAQRTSASQSLASATGAPANSLYVDYAGNVGIGTLTPGTFGLAVNGNAAKPGGGTWATLSDARLKRDIRPMSGTLDKLLSLRGVEFGYTDEAIAEKLTLPGRQFGLIAQEVAEVFPDWVGCDNEGYMHVTERGTTALMVEALRDLRAEMNRNLAERDERMNALATENAALRAELEHLRVMIYGVTSARAGGPIEVPGEPGSRDR